MCAAARVCSLCSVVSWTSRRSSCIDRVRDESRDCTLSGRDRMLYQVLAILCGCDSAFYCVCSSRLPLSHCHSPSAPGSQSVSVSVSRSGRPHSHAFPSRDAVGPRMYTVPQGTSRAPPCVPFTHTRRHSHRPPQPVALRPPQPSPHATPPRVSSPTRCHLSLLAGSLAMSAAPLSPVTSWTELQRLSG